MRLLVVEDYAPMRIALAKGLRDAGYAVDVCVDGEDGEWHARAADYDLLILDIMLPKKDGLAVVRSLRNDRLKVPILLLTARDAPSDRITGLDNGADDYLVKPFDFGELLARVRSLTRRQTGVRTSIIQIADLSIDLAARRVTRSDVSIDLTGKEFALLELLALNEGAVVTRTQIWEKIYDYTSDVGSNVVDVYVGYLRRKIERPGAPRLLHTRRGQGYVLGVQP